MSTPPGETRREPTLGDLMERLTLEVKKEMEAEELGQSMASSASGAEELLVKVPV